MNKGNAARCARVGLPGLTPLLLLALLVSCNDSTGPIDEKEVTSLLVSAEMGVLFQHLSVTRDGEAVTDALVRVNGERIAHAAAGLYEGELSTPAPEGSALKLRVIVGEANVWGTVDMPEKPVLRAPGTVFAITNAITVRWTSKTDPDRFGVYVQSNEAVWQREVLGTEREIVIAATEFPEGADLTIGVVAYNDGECTGPVDPDSRVSIRGEAATAGVIVSDEVPPLLIRGGMQGQSQKIWIFQGGTEPTDGVSDAVVTVNGVTIPKVDGQPHPGYYSGELPIGVPPGSPLDLRVSARGLSLEATGDVPAPIVLNAPATGTEFASTDSVTVRWTSATDPDRFGVYVNTDPPVWQRQLPGTAREITIAATELVEGAELTILVVPYNDGQFSGSAHADSRMGIMDLTFPPPVITIIDEARVRSALTRALQDEYRMYFTYTRVMADLGDIAPFKRAAREETSHIATLTELFTERGLDVPPSDWSEENVPTYSSRTVACVAAWNGEGANARLYETLLAQEWLPNDVVTSFSLLRGASLDSHGKAFYDCFKGDIPPFP